MTRREVTTARPSASPWPHRLAWVLACATFVLIYVGGSVTTYNAGMAIPDWPTTEGAWFYPLPKWLAAEWDVFLEHGHRMLAQGVLLITIALALALWRLDRRTWVRWLGMAAVAGVLLQATLGGLRVLAGELLLAKVHGCTAPVFFSLTGALVTLTSPRWLESGTPEANPAARQLQLLALALTPAFYLQIVLGAQLRHLRPEGRPGWFELWVWVILITAGLIAIGVVWLFVLVLRRVSTEVMLVRRATVLLALFCVQLLLGVATWVTNYGWPLWFKDYVWPLQYTIVAQGRLQVVTTTLHAAAGSLSLVAALSLALWSRRLLRGPAR